MKTDLRILLANDDGYDAPGLAYLEAAAGGLTDDLWIVAPERKWTAASHQLTFDRDLVLRRRRLQRYSCSGSPADCVVGALTVLFDKAKKPDLVLAGVNDGRNVGEDVAYSGTMAIAREATFWGVPAIAFSRTKGAIIGSKEVEALEALIRRLWELRPAWSPEEAWLGVNLPASLPAPIEVARTGRDKIAGAADILSQDDDAIVWRIRRGRPKLSRPGDENAAIDGGRIAVVRHRWNASFPFEADQILRGARG